MLKFVVKKVAKEIIYTELIFVMLIDDTVISKLIETKNISKVLIGNLDKVIRPLVLIWTDMLRQLKNNKLRLSQINNENLFEKYKVIWTKIKHLKNIVMNAFSVYDDSYIKTRIKAYGDKVYTVFCSLNIPESFTVTSMDSLLMYKKNITFK